MKSIILALLLISQSVFFQERDLEKDFNDLINSELAFSSLSGKEGIKKAFVTYLDDEGIIFRPTPVNGKLFYNSRQDITGKLFWKPNFADISVSGDFGYTTGPWEFSEKKGKAYGYFVSVWHKINDKDWRVLIDAGIPIRDSIEVRNTAKPVMNNFVKQKTVFDSVKSSFELLALDSSIVYKKDDEVNKNKVIDLLASEMRVYVTGYKPIIGKSKAIDYFKKNRKDIRTQPESALISRAGDLAYTYGLMEIGKEQFSYLHIWKRSQESNWQLVLEITNPNS